MGERSERQGSYSQDAGDGWSGREGHAAPQVASKDVAKDLADTLGPVLTEALKKGKGTVTVDVRGGRGTVTEQPESGFGLEMTPSGGF